MAAALSGNTWAWGGSESSANAVSPSWVDYPIPGLLMETSSYLLTAVENGGAGRSKMVALGGVDLP